MSLTWSHIWNSRIQGKQYRLGCCLQRQMGCLSFQPYLEEFVIKGQKAYKEYIKTNEISEVLPCEVFFEEVEVRLREEKPKLETEEQFLSETNNIYERLCNNIKDEEKQYEMAQELDIILIQIIKDVEERKTLQLAGKLQKKIGHSLQRYRSVCGYGLSGVFMNFEIKMLKNSHEQDDILAFLEKILKLDEELKDMKMYDLVTFVVIDELPVLDPDHLDHMMLKIFKKKNGCQIGLPNEAPSTQTVGGCFQIEGEDGYFFSTVTHGEDFKDHKFVISLEGMDQEKAEYWDSVYVMSCLTPSKSCLGIEKDLHSAAVDEGYAASGESRTSRVPLNISSLDDLSEPMSEDAYCPAAAKEEGRPLFALETPEGSDVEVDTELQEITNNLLRASKSARLGAKTMKRLQYDQSMPSPRPYKFVKPSFDYLDQSRSLNNSPFVDEGRRSSKTHITPKNQSCLSLGDSGFGSALSSRNTSILSLNSSYCDSPTQALSEGFSRMSSENNDSQTGTNPKVHRNQTCPDIQSFGQAERGIESAVDGHVDLCLLKVDSAKMREYVKKDRPDDQMVENIIPVTEEIMNKTVKKYGIGTQVREGKVVAVDYTVYGRLKGKEVCMYNMVITEQKHNFEKSKSPQLYSVEPVNLMEDVKNSDAVKANENQAANMSSAVGGTLGEATAGPPPPFVARGDSGAIVTITPSGDEKKVHAFANHLYHYNSKRNVYQKELNYSVSSPLCHCLEKLEQKIGKKIKIIPTVIPM